MWMWERGGGGGGGDGLKYIIFHSPCVAIVSVLQGMDAMMVPPLRGFMSKLVEVEDLGEYKNRQSTRS